MEIGALKGHNGKIKSVAFNNKGTILASGSSDETIKLWNIETKTEIATLREHNNCIISVAFNNNGTTLASGSKDKTIKLWNIETGNNLEELNTKANNDEFFSIK